MKANASTITLEHTEETARVENALSSTQIPIRESVIRTASSQEVQERAERINSAYEALNWLRSPTQLQQTQTHNLTQNSCPQVLNTMDEEKKEQTSNVENQLFSLETNNSSPSSTNTNNETTTRGILTTPESVSSTANPSTNEVWRIVNRNLAPAHHTHSDEFASPPRIPSENWQQHLPSLHHFNPYPDDENYVENLRSLLSSPDPERLAVANESAAILAESRERLTRSSETFDREAERLNNEFEHTRNRIEWRWRFVAVAAAALSTTVTLLTASGLVSSESLITLAFNMARGYVTQRITLATTARAQARPESGPAPLSAPDTSIISNQAPDPTDITNWSARPRTN